MLESMTEVTCMLAQPSHHTNSGVSQCCTAVEPTAPAVEDPEPARVSVGSEGEFCCCCCAVRAATCNADDTEARIDTALWSSAPPRARFAAESARKAAAKPPSATVLRATGDDDLLNTGEGDGGAVTPDAAALAAIELKPPVLMDGFIPEAD